MKRLVVALLLAMAAVLAQEANSGFEIHGTLSGLFTYADDLTGQPRAGSPVMAGVRAVLYPTVKLNSHWSISAALAIHSRPYYFEEFLTQGYGLKTDVLQLNLAYSRLWRNRSFVFRAGQMQSAFGSFLLRYDDAVNPLIQMPVSYGYYGAGISNLGLAGAQIDATAGKVDLRAQFVNSSPANRRSIFDREQYGSWAGGAGYTIAQGFRVGVSAYRGAYLDRHFPYYFPGEAKPRDLPGSAYGIDGQWGRGPWNVYGELQRFQFTYKAIPTFNEAVGYVELRRVLHPRWYLAGRTAFMRTNATPDLNVWEAALGYRPNRYQLIKFGYTVRQQPGLVDPIDNIFAVQYVTVLRPWSVARD